LAKKGSSSYVYIMPLLYFKSRSSLLQIASNLKIRKISQSELISLEQDLPTIFNEFEMQAASYALERVATSGELLFETYDMFQKVITAFRLLKAGPLYTKVIFMVRPDSTVKATWKFKGIPPHPDYYILNKRDLKQLFTLLGSLKHIYAPKAGNKSLTVATKFFEKSYEDDWETAIVSCWTAFEALCFGGEKPREGAIGPTVKIAVSMLIGQSRKEREQIKSFLARVYKARNYIVHGNERTSREDIHVVKRLQDYLRTSIVKLLD